MVTRSAIPTVVAARFPWLGDGGAASATPASQSFLQLDDVVHGRLSVDDADMGEMPLENVVDPDMPYKVAAKASSWPLWGLPKTLTQ